MKAFLMAWRAWLLGHLRGLWLAPAPSRFLPPPLPAPAGPITAEEEIRRAEEARRLLDNALFQQACADIYAQLRRARQATHTTRPQEIADLVRVEQIADKFFGYFQLIADTGKFAQEQLTREQGRVERHLKAVQAFANLGRNSF